MSTNLATPRPDSPRMTSFCMDHGEKKPYGEKWCWRCIEEEGKEVNGAWRSGPYLCPYSMVEILPLIDTYCFYKRKRRHRNSGLQSAG